MSRRVQITGFHQIDMRTDEGEVVGLVLSLVDDDGPIDLDFTQDAARHFMRSLGVFAQTVPEI